MRVLSRAVGAQTGQCQTRKFPISFSTGALFLLSASSFALPKGLGALPELPEGLSPELMELPVPWAGKELLELIPDVPPDQAEPPCSLPCGDKAKKC